MRSLTTNDVHAVHVSSHALRQRFTMIAPISCRSADPLRTYSTLPAHDPSATCVNTPLYNSSSSMRERVSVFLLQYNSETGHAPSFNLSLDFEQVLTFGLVPILDSRS